MQNLLVGKNVFLTGVGGNIGRHVALEMAAQGAAIYFLDSDESCCARLHKDLQLRGVTARGWTLDIAQPATLQKLQRELVKQRITIDILVNNIGVNMAQLTAHPPQNELSHQEKQRTLFDTNVLGPLALTEWIAQTMIDAKTGGSILFLSSIHQWSYYGDVAYSASKAAVGTMVHEMALQLAPHGIRVNGLAPGFVCAEADGTPPPHAPTPLHHTAIHPQYIGRAAVYLASDYFSHCTTGTILKIDAGLSLVNYIAMKPPPPPPPRLWIHKTARHYRHQLRQYLKKL